MNTSPANQVQVGTVNELKSGQMKEVRAQGRELLFARVGDRYYVTEGRCPHMRGHLARGRLDGSVITCPVHGSQFNITDGHVDRWTNWPAPVLAVAKLFRPPRPLKTYRVKIDGDRVMAELT